MKNIRRAIGAMIVTLAAVLFGFGTASVAIADTTDTVPIYRLYNRYSGEHLFTKDTNERASSLAAGWDDEHVAWDAPSASSTPVYRLYNEYTGEHLYTADDAEKTAQLAAGWTDEGIAWYSDDAKGVGVYRLFNPYSPEISSHHYTTDEVEYNTRVAEGWRGESVKWFGVKADANQGSGSGNQGGSSGNQGGNTGGDTQPSNPNAEPYYWVNTSSKKIHGDSCPSFSNANFTNGHWTKVMTPEEAQNYLNQGYEKCSKCNPIGI